MLNQAAGEGVVMAENVLKVIEVLSESERSWEDAAQQAVARAAKTVHGIKSIYIKNFEARTATSRSCWIRAGASATRYQDRS